MTHFLLYSWTALLILVVSSDNLNFLTLSNVHRPSITLLSPLFRKRERHDLPPNVTRSIEMQCRFLLWSEVTKGLSFILEAAASVIVTKGKRTINIFE